MTYDIWEAQKNESFFGPQNFKEIFRDMRKMQEEMDSMFRRFFSEDERKLLPGATTLQKSNYRKPLADITETDKEIVATIELPGVTREDINLNITDSGIEIKVEKKTEKKENKEGMHMYERSYTGFYRHLPLPSHVKAENADATYKNGILEIRIPKDKEKSKLKRIDVK